MFRRFIQSVLFYSFLSTSLEAVEYAYVPNTGGSYPIVSQVNLSLLKIFNNFDLNDGNVPYPGNALGGVAITPNYKYLYVCGSGIYKAPIPLINGTTVSKIEIASGSITNITSNDFSGPIDLAITPDGKFVIVTNLNNNKITMIDSDSNAVISVDNNGFSINRPGSIAITPKGDKAFIVGFGSPSKVYVLDIAQKKITNVISSANSGIIDLIAITPDGQKAFVTNYHKNLVSVIDLLNEKGLYDIENIERPRGIAISPSGKKAYITSYSKGVVYYLDLTQGSSVKPEIISLGVNSSTIGVAFNASGSRVYVCAPYVYAVLGLDTATNLVVSSITGFTSLPSFIAITPLPYPSTIQESLFKFLPVKFQR